MGRGGANKLLIGRGSRPAKASVTKEAQERAAEERYARSHAKWIESHRELDEDGDVIWYDDDRMKHRIGFPAWEGKDGSRHWWLHGERHREDGPAIEEPNGDKEWYVNGKLHRLDGPAVDL